jgi:hypothetical protein
MLEVMAFMRYVRDVCEDGPVPPTSRQVLKFVTRIWNVSLNKTLENSRCSLTQACIRLQTSGLELPAAEPTDRTGSSAGGGSSRGGGGGRGGSSRGSGNFRIPKRSVQKQVKVETDSDDSDSDAPPKRRSKAKKPTKPKDSPKPKKAKKIHSKSEPEPEEYDSDWGGSKYSKLACYAIVNNGPDGCKKEHCDYSHRPSICDAARKKNKKEKAPVLTDYETDE